MEQLAHPASASLLCSICQDIFQDPVINPACSHSFCRACIFQAVQQANRCPLCRASLASDKVHPNLALAGLIGDLRANCRYRPQGCLAQMTLEQVLDHEKRCEYAPFRCPHAARGCKFSGNKSGLPEHLRSCPFEIFGDFLEAIDRKYALLERRIELQNAEIALLRARLEGGSSPPHLPRVPSLSSISSSSSSSSSSAASSHLVSSLDSFPAPSPVPLEPVDVDRFDCLVSLANAHSSGVTALCPVQTGPDRFVLYSGGHDGKIKLWDVSPGQGEGRQRREVDQAHKYTIWGLVRHQEAIFSASADSHVFSWDPETLQRRDLSSPICHPGAKIYCLASSASLLFSGSADRSIRVWDVRLPGSSPAAVLQGHSRSVWSLKCAPGMGEHTLLSAGNCGNVNLWDLRLGRARLTMNFENNEALAVDAAPDGRTVFAGSSTSKIYAFDAATGEMKTRLSGHQWEVWQVETLFSPGKLPLLASGTFVSVFFFSFFFFFFQVLMIIAFIFGLLRTGLECCVLWRDTRGPCMR